VNAPALLVTDYSQDAKTTSLSADLVSTEGTHVPFKSQIKDSHGLSVMPFGATPAVGDEKISLTVGCSIPSPISQPVEIPITFTEAVPFPTEIGTMKVEPNTDAKPYDLIDVQLSSGLAAFFPLSVMKMSLNGGEPTPLGQGTLEGSRVSVSVPTGSVCVVNGALVRDKRNAKVTVTADIAGVPNSPPPVTVDIPVDCGAIKWTTDADFQPPAITHPGVEPSDDASPSSSSGGCTAAPRSMSGGSMAALLAGVLATVAGLRRRRSHP
jgi:hypothetical protein